MISPQAGVMTGSLVDYDQNIAGWSASRGDKRFGFDYMSRMINLTATYWYFRSSWRREDCARSEDCSIKIRQAARLAAFLFQPAGLLPGAESRVDHHR